MKKKSILLASFALAIACIAGLNVVRNQATNKGLDLKLANIEALSNDEADHGETCYNTITTKDGCEVLFCGNCEKVPGTAALFSGTDRCAS